MDCTMMLLKEDGLLPSAFWQTENRRRCVPTLTTPRNSPK